jgi:hypothetical protein
LLVISCEKAVVVPKNKAQPINIFFICLGLG